MAGTAPSSPYTPSSWFPLWLKGKRGFLGIIFIIYILLNLAWTHFHWGGPQHVDLIANLLSFSPSLFASILAWRVATNKSLSTPLRRAWLLLGLSFFMFLIGNLVWAYLELVLRVEPFPSLADVFYLAFYPLGLWGLLSMPSAPQDRRERLTFWLDMLIVLTAAAMFVGYFIILPTAATSNNNLLTQIIAPAYPIGSLLLTGGILALLYRPSSQNTQSALSLLLIGMLFFVGGDFAFGYTSLTGTYAAGGWTDASWNVAQLFFALAALRKLVSSPASNFMGRWITLRERILHWLPSIAVALSYGLVAYVVLVNQSRTAEWLMVGTLSLTLFIIARQIVSPGFGDLPIRVKLILTSILVSALAVSLVIATAYFTIRTNLESVVGDSLKNDVEFRSLTLGNELSKHLDLMEGFVLGETVESGVTAANANYRGDRTAIEAQLQQQDLAWKTAAGSNRIVQGVLNNPIAHELYEFRNIFSNHSNLLLTDKYGAAVAATTRPDHYSYGAEDWWQAAYNQGRGALYISQPIFDPATQALCIFVAIPVHADHATEVIGVIRSTYRIQNILAMLTPFGLETQSSFDLLLPGGKLLDSQGNIQRINPDTVTYLKANQDASYAELNLEGTSQLVSQAQLTSYDPRHAAVLKNLNWVLIDHEKPSTAFAPLHATWRTTLLTTLFVLLLTSGVAVVLAQVLIAPISRLTQVAAQIADGDLTTQAPVESRDEIGTLAGTFNMMVRALSQTQEELQESEAHYRNLVDYSPDMIAVHSDSKYVFINPAGVKLLGAQSADELVGKNILDFIPEEGLDIVRKGIEYLTTSGDPTPLTQRKMYQIDGTSFEAEYRAIPITYAGHPAIQLVARDITERKQAEEKIHQLLAQVARQRGELEVRVAERTQELNTLNLRLQTDLEDRQQLMLSLRESEERFHLLFDASPDAILLLDPHDADGIWKIVDCNPTACKMNGYSRQELIGQSIDIFNLTASSADEFAASLERLRHEGVIYGMEATHRHKDGHCFPIEYSTSLITIGDREFLLSIDHDITERKQAEIALEKAKDSAEESRRVAETASRAKSEFLSRMSHELRTPMNAILGFAQLLQMSNKDPLTSNQKERVRQIVNGGQHLLELINEILDISRIEANRMQISPEPVSIRESVQEALDLTISLALKRNIQIVTKLGRLDVDTFVMADRQRFKQVLLNILGNAVKYNYEAGSVIITCEQTPVNHWRIAVTDTGPGISQENIARLFTPFERLNTNQQYVEGTGLGLVLAKRLIELMHGQIGVESMLGRGSTFWIDLPAAESQVAHLQRTGATELPILSVDARTILYVEDNVANYELIQQVLVDYSQIKLLWAADHKTGIELARQHRPNLILLDLHLGDGNGAEVLSQLKQDEQTSEIPVVIVSADATSGQDKRLKSLGAYAYLTKPLDVREFVHLVDELLGEKEI